MSNAKTPTHPSERMTVKRWKHRLYTFLTNYEIPPADIAFILRDVDDMIREGAGRRIEIYDPNEYQLMMFKY